MLTEYVKSSDAGRVGGVRLDSFRAQRPGDAQMPKKKRTRRRPAAERRYEVRAELANFALAKARSALTLQIYERDEKLGELQIGRGSLYWWGAHRQKSKRLGWGEVAQKLNELADAAKRGAGPH